MTLSNTPICLNLNKYTQTILRQIVTRLWTKALHDHLAATLHRQTDNKPSQVSAKGPVWCATSRPIGHRAVYKAVHWAWSTGDGRPSTVDNTWPHPLSLCVVNNRLTTDICSPHSVTVNVTWPNLLSLNAGQNSRGKHRYFWKQLFPLKQESQHAKN